MTIKRNTLVNPIFIFDLDGTLALNQHREHFVKGEKKDWDAFFEACDRDEPNLPVIEAFSALYRCHEDIRIWSGRSDAVRWKTISWIQQHLELPVIVIEMMLKMRPATDYTPDEILKRQWLHSMSDLERGRIAAVFDDRQKVVDMWRSEGIVCFQVARGDF